MVCDPAVSVEVWRLAVPIPLRVALPITVFPSRKLTVPEVIGVPPEVTVEVNVTVVP